MGGRRNTVPTLIAVVCLHAARAGGTAEPGRAVVVGRADRVVADRRPLRAAVVLADPKVDDVGAAAVPLVWQFTIRFSLDFLTL